MAMTIKQIGALLTESKIKYEYTTRGDRELIKFGFGTEVYRDFDNGAQGVMLLIALEENGEYFKLIAPRVYAWAEGSQRDKAAFLQSLLMVCWKTKLIEYEFDDSDGEVRLIVEMPLEDGVLTRKQIMRCIHGLVQLLDEYHLVIKKALEKGVIDFSLEGKKSEDDPGSGSPALSGDIGALMRQFMAWMESQKSAPSSDNSRDQTPPKDTPPKDTPPESLDLED